MPFAVLFLGSFELYWTGIMIAVELHIRSAAALGICPHLRSMLFISLVVPAGEPWGRLSDLSGGSGSDTGTGGGLGLDRWYRRANLEGAKLAERELLKSLKKTAID